MSMSFTLSKYSERFSTICNHDSSLNMLKVTILISEHSGFQSILTLMTDRSSTPAAETDHLPKNKSYIGKYKIIADTIFSLSD